MPALTYKDAGVDTKLKDRFVSDIKSLVRRTHGSRVLDNYGAFAGLFALQDPNKLFRRTYRDPILVSSTDGVGTKLKVAFAMDKHDTVGIDLVAMSVNDLITTGADPLFFLDYIAADKIDPRVHRDVVKGICDGCIQGRCALLGGETAQMPGMYHPGEYDMGGTAVGVIEHSRILDGRNIRSGDLLLGLRSSGLHSNGYSLVRRLVFEKARMSVTDHVAEFGRTLGEELLEPTRIYARPIHDVVSRYRVKKPVKAISNITGGGFEENVPRVIPKGYAAVIRRGSWPAPAVFGFLQKLGRLDEDEMYRTFNMGIGMVLVVSKYFVAPVVRSLEESGTEAIEIGHIVRDPKRQVIWK